MIPLGTHSGYPKTELSKALLHTGIWRLRDLDAAGGEIYFLLTDSRFVRRRTAGVRFSFVFETAPIPMRNTFWEAWADGFVSNAPGTSTGTRVGLISGVSIIKRQFRSPAAIGACH
jgi:hypothetical protein